MQTTTRAGAIRGSKFTRVALGAALAMTVVASAAHAQTAGPLTAPSLAGLPEAVRAAHRETEAAMEREGEVGSGSETFACMETVSRRRTAAAARLSALVQLSAAGGATDWCRVQGDATEVLQELAYGGAQNSGEDGVRPGRAYLSQCRVDPVRVPAAVSQWLTQVGARCGAPARALVREHRCAVTAAESFHLRPTETEASVGREPNENVVMLVLQRGALVRRGRSMYRVRVLGVNWEGWTFLAPSAVPSGCP